MSLESDTDLVRLDCGHNLCGFGSNGEPLSVLKTLEWENRSSLSLSLSPSLPPSLLPPSFLPSLPPSFPPPLPPSLSSLFAKLFHFLFFDSAHGPSPGKHELLFPPMGIHVRKSMHTSRDRQQKYRVMSYC